MQLSANILTALRRLPKRYVVEGIHLCEYGPSPGCVFLLEQTGKLPAICYHPKEKRWKRVRFVKKPKLDERIVSLTEIGGSPHIFTPSSIQTIQRR